MTRTPEWAATKAWPGELRRRAALAVHLEATTSSIPSALNDVLRSLADGVHDWTRADLLWSLEVAGQGHGYDNGAHLELPAMIAVRLTTADLRIWRRRSRPCSTKSPRTTSWQPGHVGGSPC
ncbi:hypothetical protein [Micromonospora sp. b486]|uniref:hypothetical protein n=1 Tax=Micromonospora sp. b486 TaxID=3053986 RepID=UPI00259CE9FD|nr:hypothetical protein [Micromonospora sp. b486]MDM4784536.1 hypothetical protein [Micromonospora sp. b486]